MLLVKCQTSLFLQSYVVQKMDTRVMITRSIKCLVQKRDKLYSKYKTNKSNKKLKTQFSTLKHNIQRNVRESYDDFIQSILLDQPQNVEETGRPNKRFGALSKRKSRTVRVSIPLNQTDSFYQGSR